MPVFRRTKKGRSTLTPSARKKIEQRFRQAVNMRSAQLDRWLDTEESKSVGYRRPGSRTSVGRQSGKRIVRILRVGPSSEADYRHMQKVAGYVARHTAQRPAKDVTKTRWRYSLMNWGHDPL